MRALLIWLSRWHCRLTRGHEWILRAGPSHYSVICLHCQCETVNILDRETQ